MQDFQTNTLAKAGEIVLETTNLRKDYDGKPVFQNINFTLHKGELLCLLGPSGVGKTTLFNTLAGLLVPEQGDILSKGHSIIGEKGHVAYMLQKDLLLPHMSILDNVCLPFYLKNIGKQEAHSKAQGYFKTFGLAGCENKYPKALSGGMRQRAAFLRTMLFGQDVFLLDEPFSALDTITKSDLHDWYLNLSKNLGLSTILITHDIDEAVKLADKVIILKGRPGEIAESIAIKAPKPRAKDFVLSKTFIDCKRHILEVFAQ